MAAGTVKGHARNEFSLNVQVIPLDPDHGEGTVQVDWPKRLLLNCGQDSNVCSQAPTPLSLCRA
jgi:hypothetical protein